MSADEARDARPIFVLGTQRSGTTLLRLILDSHPNIAIGFETGFMRAVDAIKNVPDWKHGKGWYTRYGLDDADINERIRRFYSDIFTDYAAAQGKVRWGEKTPLNVNHMEEMARIFPDAQFVCIVRHAGAVAVSLMRWGYTFDKAVDYWVTVNRRFRRLGPDLGTERFLLCRYEDLVMEPDVTLRRVVGFLNEPWSDAVLRHHEVQKAKHGDGTVEGGNLPARALDVQSVDRWRSDLDADMRRVLRAKARPLLRHFGYRPKTAVPVDHVPARGTGGDSTPLHSADTPPDKEAE